MKAIGYILLAAGFLYGSYVAVKYEDKSDVVEWQKFVPAFVIGVVGVVLAQVAIRRESTHSDTLGSNVETLTRSLSAIVERIAGLDDTKTDFNPYEFHGKIDELFPSHLNDFVEARESISHIYGLQAYARVMSEFAAGERYLNRVWSASVDGYIDEVQAYLPRARKQFEAAQGQLARLRASDR